MARVPKPRTVSTKQARIADLARQMPETALFSLSHHVDIAWMHEAYRRTRKDGAAGIDGVTAKEFEQDLEANLQALLDGFKTMEYRAPPVRRVEIPKPAGGTRSLGIPTLADKVLQRAVQMLLEPLYEQDFYDLSYGFRPNRSAHQAIDALDLALFKAGRTVWVLEVDVKSFFDTIDHQALQRSASPTSGRRPGGPVCRQVAPSGGARGWGHHDLCRWNSAGRGDLTPPVEHLPPPCARHLVGEGCAPANAGDGEASPLCG